MKNVWSKYITRRLAVQVAQAWNFGWGEAMKKIYGISVNKTLVFRDAQKTEYYVDEKEHKEYVKGLYNLLKDKYNIAISQLSDLSTLTSDQLKYLEENAPEAWSRLGDTSAKSTTDAAPTH